MSTELAHLDSELKRVDEAITERDYLISHLQAQLLEVENELRPWTFGSLVADSDAATREFLQVTSKGALSAPTEAQSSPSSKASRIPDRLSELLPHKGARHILSHLRFLYIK